MTLYLLAHVAGQPIAIPTDQIESVVDVDDVVPVPRASPFVLGLVALRSRVATVIDSWRALGSARTGPIAGRAILLRADGLLYALRVETLEDVAEAKAEPLPAGLAILPAWRAVVQEMVVIDGNPVLVLEPARLLANLSLAA